MGKTPRRIAAATISARLLLSCCFVVPTAMATTNAAPSNDLPRATIEAGDLGSTGISYTRDQDGIDAGGTYAIFYNTTRSLLYHTGTGNTDQVTGTVSGDKLTLASNFASQTQLWTIEKRDGDDGYNVKSGNSGRYLDLSQTTNANGNVKTSDQPVRVDITFHEDTGTYSLSNGSNYLTHGSTAGNKYYCSTSQDAALTQFQLYLETETTPTLVGENPKGTEAVDVPFSSAATGGQHFRIPSLYTLSNGWIVAAADIRWSTNLDSPENLDTIVSVSKDNGQTWEWEVVNYLADMTESSTGDASASFIDPSIIQDSNGTIHMVVDACPSYVGLMSGNQMGQESTGFDDEGRLLVAKGEAGTYAPKTADSYTYYVDLNNKNGLAALGSDDGTDVELYPICSQDGTATNTWVDAYLNVYEKADQENIFTKLYVEQLGNTSNRVQKNLFFQKSEWKVYPVFYIMHRTAQVTDDGLAWSAPQFLDIKGADNEKFTGVCPGRGITTTYNGNERIIFPLYDNRTGNELASVIYSDDGGTTWHRGQHNANLNNVGKTSESQIVTLPNGDLRMYSRNTINYVSYADSSDGGVTWSQCQPDQALFSQKQGGGCMVSFINLDGTLIGPDDQEYDNLILGSYARIQRSEGIVRIGSANEDGSVTWLNGDVTRYTGVNNCFAYSCLTQLQDNGNATDTFGILYENQVGPCQIVYDTIDVQDLLGEGWYMVQDKSEKVTLSLDTPFLNLTVGQSSQVQATVVPQDGATVTWSSNDPTVAMVDSTGLVSGVAAGTTTITATATTPGGIVRTAHLDVAVQGETGVNLPQRFQTTISQEEHEAQTTYDLDTDGIDSGSVYAIFHAGAQRTLYHANNTTNTDQVTGTVSNDQLTLDGQYAASRQLWRITKTEDGYTIQSMEADGKYLSLNNTATNPGSRIPVQADPFYLAIRAGETSGAYTISHTVNGQTLYLSHSNTASQQHNVSAEACEFQLFRENTVPAHTTYQVSLGALQALVDFVDTLDAQVYSSDTWATLRAAKQAAVDFIAADNSLVFDNEADAQSQSEQVTVLTEALYEAWLHLAPPECQHTYGEPEFHWSNDNGQATATFTCTQEGCHHQEVIPATVSSEVTTKPTCTEQGVTTYTATVEFSQKRYTDTQIVENIDALGHITELKNAKEATCTVDGYTGDFVCSWCGETIQKGEMIPATGHHYVDGVCDVCGQEDPNSVPPTQEPEQGVVVDNQTDEKITLGNAQEVFEDHTVITVENIEDGKLYETVEKALENVADMEHVAILDINATLDGQEVQPRGTLQMTIEIPDNLSADHLKLYCVAEDGAKSEVPITVDKDANTVTANLTHMDTYVLANILVEQGESQVPSTGDSASLALYTLTLMGAAVCLLSFATLTVRKRRS